MAKDEGWYQKKGSKWQTMPDLMLRYRSATFLIRTTAPEISMGLTKDEVEDLGEKTVDIPAEEIKQHANKKTIDVKAEHVEVKEEPKAVEQKAAPKKSVQKDKPAEPAKPAQADESEEDEPDWMLQS